MSNSPSSFFPRKPQEKKHHHNQCLPTRTGAQFPATENSSGLPVWMQDRVLLFYEERKSPALSTLDLLILYKFSPPSLGAAVISFVYLHSNNIVKTQSGFKNPPSQDIAKFNPSWCFFCVQQRHFSLYLGDTADFPSRTFGSWLLGWN